MKSFRKSIFTFAVFSVLSLPVSAERVMLITDPHVIDKTLLLPGSAADSMLSNSRKMLEHSEPIFRALIDTALLHHPDLVLIPGDLTKDGEKISHQKVSALLARLDSAGIPVLVIPGNHDIESTNSYAYSGDQKTHVENITDAEWDSIYSQFMPSSAAQRDPSSHSYVAFPFSGVTLLAIDGAHANASQGSLSDETMEWLIARADEAVQRGDMLFAMSHWQWMDHFVKKSTLTSDAKFADADSLAAILASHGVHLLFTGHFHVNSASTSFYNSAANPDSLVEISTGSPITYPCPYRWLTISNDRKSMTIETKVLQSLDTIPDMTSYSREWMKIHIHNLIPSMSIKLWKKIDQTLAANETKIKSQTGTALYNLIKAALPQNDSARVAVVEKYFSSTLTELYLLHSEANEPTREQKDSLVEAFYAGCDSLYNDMFPVIGQSEILQTMFASVKLMAQEPLESMTEDWTKSTIMDEQQNVTDDLMLSLPIWKGKDTSIGNTTKKKTTKSYDILGRSTHTNTQGSIVIENGYKSIKF